MRREIRGKRNQPLGFCDVGPDKTIAYHIKKGYCGFYVKSSDLTFTDRGELYCHGDGTDSLIRALED